MTFNSVHYPEHLYFITASVCGFFRIFADDSYARIVLDSLAWLRNEKRMVLFAYVLMPSHLHAIIQPLDRTIGDLLQNFGSHTAHAILDQLQRGHREELLEYFENQRRDLRSKHSIWQDIQAKNIFTEKFLAQKLEYIHQNPIARDSNILKNRAEYRYSSACFYDEGRPSIIPVDDIREFQGS